MEPEVRKTLRMPLSLSVKIERAAKSQSSKFSQFVRLAAIEKLDRLKKAMTETAA